MKIKHVNEGLAVRASLSKVTKNKGTRNCMYVLYVMTLVRMPVMKVLFNVRCCYKYSFVLVTEMS